MKIGIDFDGTIVEHMYPGIGKPCPEAIKWMKAFQAAGHKLILWTMRDKGPLQEAVDYCASEGVTFNAVNKGIGDRYWTTSPKAHCNVIIDDVSFGCPLMEPTESDRPMVDWSIVGPGVLELGNS